MNKEVFRPRNHVEDESHKNPEKEPSFTGIQELAVSSAFCLFNPQEGFEVINELNNERVGQGKKPVRMEIYATHYPEIVHQHLPDKLITFLEKHFPPHLSSEKTHRLFEDHAGVELHGFHDAFNFSFKEEVIRTTIGEQFLPEVPDANITDRLLLGVKNRRDQTAWVFFFGQARQRHTIEIAEEFAKDYPDLSLIFHANVAHGLDQTDELEKIKKNIPHVLAESERPYRFSPAMQAISQETGIPAWRLVSEPSLVMEHTAKRFGLDMALDADHALARGKDPITTLNETNERVREIHLSGSGGTTLHQMVDLEDPAVHQFLNQTLSSTHPNPWTLTLDINPLIMDELDSLEGEVNYFAKLFNGIESLQEEILSDKN